MQYTWEPALLKEAVGIVQTATLAKGKARGMETQPSIRTAWVNKGKGTSWLTIDLMAQVAGV